MKFYLLTNKIMTKKSGILTAIAAATVLSTTPVSAETHNQIGQQNVKKVTCATKLACETLLDSIQAQIDELDKKGEENLSDKEIDKYIALQDELIALERTETANEREETQQNNDVIKDNTEIMAKLSSIKGYL